jgi:hypothetical protein
MIDIMKKILIGLAIGIFIWALVDPNGAADFVDFLWLRVQEALGSFFTFLKNLFS